MFPWQKYNVIFYLKNPKLNQEIPKKLKQLEEYYRQDVKFNKQMLESAEFLINDSELSACEMSELRKKNIKKMKDYNKEEQFYYDLKYSDCLKQLEEFERINIIKSILNPFEMDVIKTYYEEGQPLKVLEFRYNMDHKNMTVKRDKLVEAITELFYEHISAKDILKLRELPYKKYKQMKIKGV